MTDTEFPKLLEVINQMTDQICKDVTESNKASLQSLIDKNIAKGGSIIGFTFAGRRYTYLTSKEVRKIRKWDPIHPDLYEDALALHKDTVDQERDMQRLRQGLTLPLRGSKTWQDVRDALPELVASIPLISGFPRTRPEAFNLQDKPTLLNEYNETVELITYFLSARMFY